MALDLATRFDLDKLLAPISAEQPAGEWLRHGSVYDAIREARSEDDPTLARGVWQRELKRADWEKVETLAAEALETRSKDLQLAVWLLEAWLHRHGFAGAEPGLKLLTGLCEGFWDDLWPPLEDGDPEYRLSPLRWINDKLYLAFKRIPVTRPDDDRAGEHTWADWESAVRLSRVAEVDPEKAKSAAGARVTREKLLAAVTVTPTGIYRRADADLAAARVALAELGHVLDERCGEAAPTFGQVEATLTAIHHFVQGVLRERGDEDETDFDLPPAAAGAAVGGIDDETQRALASGPIKSRADAYRRLSEAAEYLLRTEPHSPTSYLVQRAVSWGGMSLGEVLAELLHNKADLHTVYQLLGIQEER